MVRAQVVMRTRAKLDVLSVAERNDSLRGRTSLENVTQVWRTRHFRGIL